MLLAFAAESGELALCLQVAQALPDGAASSQTWRNHLCSGTCLEYSARLCVQVVDLRRRQDVSIARIFEVMVATAFYSGLVYMFYDGTGMATRGAKTTVQATSLSNEDVTNEK